MRLKGAWCGAKMANRAPGRADNGIIFKTCGRQTLKKAGRPQERIQCLQKALGVTWWQQAWRGGEALDLGSTPVGDLFLVQEEGWLTPPPSGCCCNCLPSTSICTSRAAAQQLQQQQQQQCLRFSVPQTGRLLHDSAEN